MLIDFHTHCFPDKVSQKAMEKLSFASGGLNPYTDGTVSGLRLLMEKSGVDKSVALNIATNAASTTNKAIAVFNLEMSAEMLVNRMISSVGQIDSYKLQTGRLENNDWKRYNEG